MNKFYNTFKCVLLFLILLAGGMSASAQTASSPGFKFKVQLMESGTQWGIYAMPANGYVPTASTQTATGAQVTLKITNTDSLHNITSVTGIWNSNPTFVHSPDEAPGFNYYSVGISNPANMDYTDSIETLLFTFESVNGCFEDLSIIDNYNDPFNVPNNSADNNPGNEFAVIDFGTSPNSFVNWVDNYNLEAWSCADCDMDGIPDAFEDTNGNGVFDAGDASDLCDVCDPIHVETAVMGDSIAICEAESVDLYIDIQGGWSPYDVTYTDGTNNIVVEDYVSGDPITVSPAATTHYSIVTILDDSGCEIAADSITGGALITVEGDIYFTDTSLPADVEQCGGSGTSFTATAANDGEGVLTYQWQYSNDGGVNYFNVLDGTNYSGINTATLVIDDVTGLHDYRFQCLIGTEACVFETSRQATLSVDGPLSIGTSPMDVALCGTDSHTFTAFAENTGTGSMNLQWQISTDDGATWTDLTDAAPYNGVTTLNLDISSVAGLNGNLYRMEVSSNYCTETYTDEALLTVTGPLTVTTPIADASQCAGAGALFFVEVDNPGNDGADAVNYIWQISTDSGTSFSDLANDTNYNGVFSSSLSIDDVTGLDGFQYQVLISTDECTQTVQGPAVLDVYGPIDFTANPDDTELCAGNATSFTAEAFIAQGTLAYQWQLSTDNGATWSDLTDTAPYSGATTQTLNVATTTATMDNYQYRVLAQTSECEDTASEEAVLRVEGPLTVSAQPVDVTECAGNSAQFSIAVDNPGSGTVEYRWQYYTGTAWVDLNNGPTYGGVQTNTLIIADVNGLNGNDYRVTFQTAECNVDESATVTLVTEGPIAVSADPEDFSACTGETASFSAAVSNAGAGTLTYLWQYSEDNGVNWTDITATTHGGIYSDFTATVLNVSDVTDRDLTQYRLTAETGECLEIASLPAVLFEEGPVTIDPSLPVDAAQCAGNSVIFNVGVTLENSGTLDYIWEYSTDEVNWTDVPNNEVFNGNNTDTLSISNVAGLDGYYFRAQVFTGECAATASPSAQLTVTPEVSVSNLDAQRIACADDLELYSVTVSEAAAEKQWQVSVDEGVTWTDLTDDGVNYLNTTSTSITIYDIPTAFNGNYYRLRVVPTLCDTLYTNSSLLVVEGEIGVSETIPAQTVCAGDGTSFSVTTTNPGAGTITHQWQFSTNGTDWFDLVNNTTYNGVTTDNMSITNVAGLNGLLFRDVVQSGACSQEISGVANLTVEGPITYANDAHPVDLTTCFTDGATFTSAPEITAGAAGTMTYQWQVSSDNINFADLSDGAVYSDVTTTTLTINDLTGLSGRYYRLATQSSVCDPVFSNSARLTVEGPVSFDVDGQPDDVVSCSGLGVTFDVQVSNPGEGNIEYQWQQSTDNGSTWTDLTNVTNVNGVTTDTLSIDDVLGYDDYLFRAVMTVGSCGTVISDPALLNVEGPLAITTDPEDVIVCSGDGATFTAAGTNGSGGGTDWTWEFSTNNGITWTTVPDASPYSGTDAATLNISDVAGLGGYRYRAVLGSDNCVGVPSAAAKLTVEGPITLSSLSDQDVCSNIDATFNVAVVNGGSGTLDLQWQVLPEGSSTWTDLSNNALYTGATTNNLYIDSVGLLNNYSYRLLATTSTCTVMSDQALLTLSQDTLGHCDFDLDGLDNDTDLDDDNDGLSDLTEIYISTSNDPDDYVYQFDTDTDNDGIPDGEEDADDDTIDNEEETDTDDSYDGDPLDPCDPIISPACVGVVLDLTVKLQGAMRGTNDGLMRDDLRAQGLIPLTEPYSSMTDLFTGEALFPHVGEGGGETITDSTAVLGVTGENAIVDWVFVELRSNLSLDSIIATRSALVQRDGDIVDTDGVSLLEFDSTQAGEYYVSVRHRNHLGVMSNDAGVMSPIVTEFDFTDTSYTALGAFPMYVTQDSTDRYMWMGDLNSDGRTIYSGPNNDNLILFSQVLLDAQNPSNLANFISAGYKTSDMDLDGRSIYQGPGNEQGSMLFEVIYSYPGNVNILTNFAINQQLP